MKRLGVALVALSSSVASAQGRPFSFTVPFPDETPQAVVRYDGGWSNGSFEPLSGDHIQQTSELDSPIGSRVLLMMSGGEAFLGPAASRQLEPKSPTRRSMEQVETLVDVLRFSGWHLAASAGARHDFDGSVMALSRLSLSRTAATWSFAANVYATKPVQGAVLSPKGIPWADVTASVGATRNVTPGVSLGIETVAGNAESLLSHGLTGSAAILIAPLASFALPGHRARLTVSGGPIVQPYNGGVSSFESIGKYSTPMHVRQTGYNLRLAVSFGL